MLRRFASVPAGYVAGMAIDEVLDPQAARELIASNEATVLDIRDDDEWHDKRVPGARRAFEPELDTALEEIEEDRALVIVCSDGKRSARLAAQLRERGRDAACIDGGMKAWERKKFAVQPSSDPDDDVRI
jgi:rhodanese-related sulfurtransferase